MNEVVADRGVAAAVGNADAGVHHERGLVVDDEATRIDGLADAGLGVVADRGRVARDDRCSAVGRVRRLAELADHADVDAGILGQGGVLVQVGVVVRVVADAAVQAAVGEARARVRDGVDLVLEVERAAVGLDVLLDVGLGSVARGVGAARLHHAGAVGDVLGQAEVADHADVGAAGAGRDLRRAGIAERLVARGRVAAAVGEGDAGVDDVGALGDQRAAAEAGDLGVRVLRDLGGGVVAHRAGVAGVDVGGAAGPVRRLTIVGGDTDRADDRRRSDRRSSGRRSRRCCPTCCPWRSCRRCWPQPRPC